MVNIGSILLDVMPYVLILLKVGLWVFGFVFLLNGLNDLFFDLVKLGRDLWRKIFIFGLKKNQPLTEEDLLSKPESTIAIMIPCWDESAVIERMLENSMQVLNYSKYVIFVGTYPNDQATQRKVDIVRERFPNVERIVCPKDGPTSKADCLNWIYEGIRHYEKKHEFVFEIVVMEDSEDVLHPLTLKLFNYMMPRMDMVQLPVLPMEPRWYEFTRGTYLDEFATNHSRDMVVRELLSNNVPSAGVGTALSRSLLNRLYEENNHQLFTIGSVTEDYDFGIRLGNMKNIRQIFSRVGFKHTRRRKSLLTGREILVSSRDYIGIREFFPKTFRAAVRQKARWVLGITLQAWETIGWVGGFWMRYMLFRDRISLLTNQITMLGNFIVPIYLLVWGYVYLFPEAYRYPPIVTTGEPLFYLLLSNLVLLVWLVFIRCYYVMKLYGIKQAVLSPLRLIWANIINYCATVRALRLYFAHRITGSPVSWDKTDHAYPSEEELVRFRRRLGDLLLDRRFITVGQLDKALEEQKKTAQPLGWVLVQMNLLEEDKLLQVLGMQFSLETAEIDPYAQDPDVIAMIPEQDALQYRMYPMHIEDTGELVVGVDDLPNPDDVQRVENIINRKIQLRLTTRGELSFALRRGYSRIHDVHNSQHLGQELLKRSLVTDKQLHKALRKQRRLYQNLGDMLISRGYITRSQLDEFFYSENIKNLSNPIGMQLVENGLITQEQLEATLDEQKVTTPLLGSLLVDQGAIQEHTLQDVLRYLNKEEGGGE